MTGSSDFERRIVHYSGQVQGVGFRFNARSIARLYQVAGYVRNLPDGRVELLAEGNQQELERFLSHVADSMQPYIRDIRVDVICDSTREYQGFGIRH